MVNKITINLGLLEHNISKLKSLLSNDVEFIAVVKADAYGHGLIPISKAALKVGAESLAVFSPDEGVLLRASGVAAPIIVLGYTDQSSIKIAIANNLIISVFEYDQIYEISRIAHSLNKNSLVDIKIETGMNRFGFSAVEISEKINQILSLPNIEIIGVHSHLADASDSVFSRGQIRSFKNIINQFVDQGVRVKRTHLLATEGTFRYPEAQFSAVRIGIGMYGIYGFETTSRALKPILSLTSKIAQIKEIKANESVSYKRTFITRKPIKVAVLPIGYADGVPRSLSNIGEVLVAGRRAKICGRICMNALMIDITGIECGVGESVVLIGESGNDKIMAEELAKLINTNPHEILTGLSKDLSRVYI